MLAWNVPFIVDFLNRAKELVNGRSIGFVWRWLPLSQEEGQKGGARMEERESKKNSRTKSRFKQPKDEKSYISSPLPLKNHERAMGDNCFVTARLVLAPSGFY
jgi:hypothetical protein